MTPIEFRLCWDLQNSLSESGKLSAGDRRNLYSLLVNSNHGGEMFFPGGFSEPYPVVLGLSATGLVLVEILWVPRTQTFWNVGPAGPGFPGEVAVVAYCNVTPSGKIVATGWRAGLAEDLDQGEWPRYFSVSAGPFDLPRPPPREVFNPRLRADLADPHAEGRCWALDVYDLAAEWKKDEPPGLNALQHYEWLATWPPVPSGMIPSGLLARKILQGFVAEELNAAAEERNAAGESRTAVQG